MVHVGNCLGKIICLSDFPLRLLATRRLRVPGQERSVSSNCLPLIGCDSRFQLAQFFRDDYGSVVFNEDQN